MRKFHYNSFFVAFFAYSVLNERMILIWQITVTQIYTFTVPKRSWQTSLKSSKAGRARMSANRKLPLAAAGSASSLRAPVSRPLISALALKKSSSTAKDSSLSSIYLQTARNPLSGRRWCVSSHRAAGPAIWRRNPAQACTLPTINSNASSQQITQFLLGIPQQVATCLRSCAAAPSIRSQRCASCSAADMAVLRARRSCLSWRGTMA